MAGPFKCYMQKKINISSECNKHFRHYRHHQFHPHAKLLHFFDSTFSNYYTAGFSYNKTCTARQRALNLHFILCRFFRAKRTFEFVPYRSPSSHNSQNARARSHNAGFPETSNITTVLLNANDELTKKTLYRKTSAKSVAAKEQIKYNLLQMHILSNLKITIGNDLSVLVTKMLALSFAPGLGNMRRGYATCADARSVRAQVQLDAFAKELAEQQKAQRPSMIAHDIGTIHDTFARELAEQQARLEKLEIPLAAQLQTLLDTDTFAATQILLLRNAFKTQDYGRVYAMYQALARNGFHLATVDDYNILLLAISRRSPVYNTADCIDESVEENLSKLLTVYEALLSQSHTVRPTSETYAIVLALLLDGAAFEHAQFQRAKTQLAHTPHSRNGSDYYQLALLIFKGIATGGCKHSAHPEIVDKLLMGLNVYATDAAELYGAVESASAVRIDTYLHYHTSCVNGARTMQNLLDAYAQFQDAADVHPHLMREKYTVYALLLKNLVTIGEVNTATKFLDDIVLAYAKVPTLKASCNDGNIAGLVNNYLMGLVTAGKCEKAFVLLKKFHNASFLPSVDGDVCGQLLLTYAQAAQATSDVKNVSGLSYPLVNEIFDWYMSMPPTASSLVLKNYPLSGAPLRDEVISFLMVTAMNNTSNPDAAALFTKLLKVTLSHSEAIRLNLGATRSVVTFLLDQATQDASAATVLTKFLMHQYRAVAACARTEANLWFSGVVDLLVPRVHCHNNFMRDAVLTSLLLQLSIIEPCVRSYKLQQDNIFGIIQLFSAFIFPKYHQPMAQAPEEVERVLGLEARLISEFEDTENHYVELPQELVEFKANLKRGFRQLWESVGASESYSDEVKMCL
ncbi:hypothetical protein BABINDRAFT_92713 [Babjeviella inositovora NRRL Y-12698]|uniref:Uncharacterized protein n=1 Tax=Babjeviella inositovora NRRL Y-12698 TaxID=984486 RepID=A0A1E3QKA1_9ASCO|nr:uncharacterized protein BABINDRAFT_92713 [Babjeviella inositovora NRRL Y-12698]ODQ78111.1 hypothetical protein BABINDRAFT_92713 [Babjeviella inositovora NRRL Y-12698]